MDQEEQQQYQQMRGEYLSLMASLEYNLTLLIHDELLFADHHAAFYSWIIDAPIPFTSKVSLFEQIYKNGSTLKKFG